MLIQPDFLYLFLALFFPLVSSAQNDSLSYLEEYQVFEQEQAALRKDLPEDFYMQYHAYLKLYQRYGKSTNPKIAQAWEYANRGLKYGLYLAEDTLMERIAADFKAGRFDRSVSKEVAEGLFAYWGRTGNLKSALQLLQVPEYEAYFENKMETGGYLISIVKNTQLRLDSVGRIKQAPDQRLYAVGKVWLDYCFQKVGFRFKWGRDPRPNFEQAYQYFRTLIQQYPNSPLADNAAYDTLYYIDYRPCCSSDHIPPGNDAEAYRVFTQFLKDYPQSDRRPDVLLRLSNAIARGVRDEHFHEINRDDAAKYLQIIETDYPEFARLSEEYQKSAGRLKARAWSGRWEMFVAVHQPAYRLTDTIRFNVRIRNKSRAEQTLDTAFLSHWHEGLQLNLNQVRDKNSEAIWGHFALLREKTPGKIKTIALPPGGSYEETFFLNHTSLDKNGHPEKFDVASGHTYLYFMEYRHPKLTWLSAEVRRGEPFRVE